jgi:hypothetical protein
MLLAKVLLLLLIVVLILALIFTKREPYTYSGFNTPKVIPFESDAPTEFEQMELNKNVKISEVDTYRPVDSYGSYILLNKCKYLVDYPARTTGRLGAGLFEGYPQYPSAI